MKSRPLLLTALAACSLAFQQPAMAERWSAVPGAPELAVDLGSLRQEHARVTVWVRWWGWPATVVALSPQLARPPRVTRSVVLTEFDCTGRTLRAMAAHAYDASGTPVLMSSIPGPLLPLQGEELGWTYDAVCEMARNGARL
jgi:hypothetical protein